MLSVSRLVFRSRPLGASSPSSLSLHRRYATIPPKPAVKRKTWSPKLPATPTPAVPIPKAAASTSAKTPTPSTKPAPTKAAAPLPAEAEPIVAPAPDPTLSPTPTPPVSSPEIASPLPASQDSTIPPLPPAEGLTPSTSLAQQYLDLADPSAASSSSGSSFPGSTTGARAKGSGNKSTIEKKRQNVTRGLMLSGLLGLAGAAVWLGREWESEEEKMRLVGRTEDFAAVDESERGGWEGWVGRTKLRGEDAMDYLNKPAWDPLLPPPLPEPHFRPYTLVLDLDDLLVHSSWDIEHGWRTAKRPGVDYFLAYMSQFYEIVLFTTQPAYTAAPIVEKIDPYGAYIPWKLFRESTRYKNKSLIKDLSYLGRPLERTIILDTDPSHFQLQPQNGIALAPWRGTQSDPTTARELVALIPFLEALAIKNVKDVRPVITHYEGRHIPTAYAVAEKEAKDRLLRQWEESKSQQSGWVGWFAQALGSLVKTPSRDVPPETDVEKVRRNAQRMYLEEQKYWKDNEASIKKQMDDDREKQLKEMKSSLLGMFGGMPKPPEQSQGTQ